MPKTSIWERNKAIRLAWEREQGLVSEGKGTRDWTEAQQKDILCRFVNDVLHIGESREDLLR